MKKNIWLLLIVTLFSSCFELDNYDAPDAGIDGKLIDKETGEIVYTEQPDGCRIRLYDLSYENPTPLDFWAKADGTFRNVALFSGDYEVAPVEGAIFPMENETVRLKGVTNHDFKVTPFLKVNYIETIPGENEAGTVTVKFNLKRSVTPEGMEIGKKTISEAWVLCNTIPVVSYYNGGYIDKLSVKKVLSRTSDENIENKEQEITLTELESGKKYYLRVAALSSCSYNTTLKRYNYSEIFEYVAP